jgi:hypothetical protein
MFFLSINTQTLADPVLFILHACGLMAIMSVIQSQEVKQGNG